MSDANRKPPMDAAESETLKGVGSLLIDWTYNERNQKLTEQYPAHAPDSVPGFVSTDKKTHYDIRTPKRYHERAGVSKKSTLGSVSKTPSLLFPGDPRMLYLGIDQHKRQLTVNLRGEDWFCDPQNGR